MQTPLISFYAVRNEQGKYFRSKGYCGYGDTWVDSLNNAKIYSKIGQARGRVTYFANNYPKFKIPQIVELQVTNAVAIDETARVKKAQENKAKADAKYAKYIAEYTRRNAEKQIADAQNILNNLNK